MNTECAVRTPHPALRATFSHKGTIWLPQSLHRPSVTRSNPKKLPHWTFSSLIEEYPQFRDILTDTEGRDRARSIYSDKLKNRTNRFKLPIKKKPIKVLIAPGIFLCYGRNEGPGTWSYEAGYLKRFAVPDDYDACNDQPVMSYHQAQQRALKLARGSDKSVTVGEA